MGLNDALEVTEENVYTRIEMGQLTALFARELAVRMTSSEFVAYRFIYGIVHVRYTWALGTLLHTALQRYDPRYVVDAGAWASDITRLAREGWCGISKMGKEIHKVVPDFVPEDPMCEWSC